MKSYTVRFAHLKEIPIPMIGDIIYRGEKVGQMGSTGKSTATHLHIDVVEGLVNRIIRLKEIGYEKGKSYIPNIEQLNYFIDEELLDTKPIITTYFYDPQYKIDWKKDHPGYDLIPLGEHDKDEDFNIYWNRSQTGTILDVNFDAGYGNYILIGFEVL